MPPPKKRRASVGGGIHPSPPMLTSHRQSGLQDQLYLTVVLKTTNGAFMNCETEGCSGAVKSSPHEEPLTLLLFPSEKGLNSVRGTGCQLQLWQNGSDKEARVPFNPLLTGPGPNDNQVNPSTKIIL